MLDSHKGKFCLKCQSIKFYDSVALNVKEQLIEILERNWISIQSYKSKRYFFRKVRDFFFSIESIYKNKSF